VLAWQLPQPPEFKLGKPKDLRISLGFELDASVQGLALERDRYGLAPLKVQDSLTTIDPYVQQAAPILPKPM
jgi:hypothetical protein